MNDEKICRIDKKMCDKKIRDHLFVAHFLSAAMVGSIYSLRGEETGQLSAVAIHSARTASPGLGFSSWIPQLADGRRDGK